MTQQLSQQQQQQVLSQAMAAISSSIGTMGQRERLRAGVFRPGHELPSMTVEEFGELEVQRMREQESMKMEVEAQQRREEAMSVAGGGGWPKRGMDDDDEHNDEEVMKQRARDDWKDSNPYGHGNSALRPCGR